jgi:ribonuclease BN (tRNA processing enzyme)
MHCQNKIITYSGDTQWTDTLPAAANGADLFISEAYFFDKVVKNHLAYVTVQAHRDELNAKRTVLTHMGKDMLQRLGSIDAETASDGLTIEI